MAWDVWKRRNDGRDFGRGAPPPVESHEWAGVAPSAAEAIVREERKRAAGKTPPAKVAARATVGAEQGSSDTKKPWWMLAAGFVVGLIAGSWGRGDE